MSRSVWHEADDALHDAVRGEHLTMDQKLRAAEVKALLAIGQELSMIRNGGINPHFDVEGG